MFDVPLIVTPTVEKSGYKPRFGVQEFYEEIQTTNDEIIEVFSMPSTPVSDLDFAWFLGVGTLPLEFEKSLFVVGAAEGDKIKVRYPGQLEYAIKPGITERNGVNFYRVIEPIVPALPCNPNFNNLLVSFPLSVNFAEVISNRTVNFIENVGDQPTGTNFPFIDFTESDPYGVPGVAKFNGENGFNVAAGDIDLTGDCTIQFWFKPTSIHSSGFGTLYDFRQNSDLSFPHNFYYIQDSLSVKTFGVGWLTSFYPDMRTSSGWLLNVWNFIRIVRIGTTLYISCNGTVLLTLSGVNTDLSSSGSTWYIGGFRAVPSFFFKGLYGFMTQFEVYNIALPTNTVPSVRYGNTACEVVMPE
jgi:hypothetical protein